MMENVRKKSSFIFSTFIEFCSEKVVPMPNIDLKDLEYAC